MRKATAAVILGASTLALLMTSLPAQATGSEEADFLRMLNQRRTSQGKKALKARSDLTAIARNHSARMADAEDIFHNTGVGREVKGEREVGENVGVGQDPEGLDVAFWESAGHRANILYAGFNEVGVGVAHSEYELYVTFVFVDRPAATTTVPRVSENRTRTVKTPSHPTSRTTSSVESADGSGRRDTKRGVSRPPALEPARSVDLLVRTVALDAA